MKQLTFDEEMKEMFGGKVYRLSLSSGCSCPNRDGKAGTGGCIFCSAGGSGEFAACGNIDVQIEEAKKKVARKLSKNFAGYMAYFQSFTNTYGPAEQLRALFSSALEQEDILALSVATRPDCLPDEMIGMLAELNLCKPVWVELGLQTAHEDTAALIHRGYTLDVFEDAVRRLKAAGLRVVVHVIIGLPGEDAKRTRDTIRYLANFSQEGRSLLDENGQQGRSLLDENDQWGRSLLDENGQQGHSFSQEGTSLLIDGIKLQILQVLKGTQLAEMVQQDPGIIPSYTLEEYASLLKELLEILPEEITVHRLTGDPPKSLLISPLWTADKKKVLNMIKKAVG